MKFWILFLNDSDEDIDLGERSDDESELESNTRFRGYDASFNFFLAVVQVGPGLFLYLRVKTAPICVIFLKSTELCTHEK